jgi:hypothetical protein
VGALGRAVPDPPGGPRASEDAPRPQVTHGQRTRERLPVLPVLVAHLHAAQTDSAPCGTQVFA